MLWRKSSILTMSLYGLIMTSHWGSRELMKHKCLFWGKLKQTLFDHELILCRKKFHFSDQNVDRNDPVQLNLLFHQVYHCYYSDTVTIVINVMHYPLTIQLWMVAMVTIPYRIVGFFFEVRKFRKFRGCWSFVKFNPSKNELPIEVLSFWQTHSWE